MNARTEPRFVADITLSTNGTDWWATVADHRMILTTVRGASAYDVLIEAAKVADRLAAGKAAA